MVSHVTACANLKMYVCISGGKACGSTKKGHTCYGSSCPRRKKCYARSSLVSLANGDVIRMDDLRVGQLVQVTDPAGIQGTSKFVGWTEKHRSLTEFHRLTTESGNILTMTGSFSLHIEILKIVVIKQFFRKSWTLYLESWVSDGYFCQRPFCW